MANRWFTKIFGTRFDRDLKRIQPIVDAIHQHEVRLKEIGTGELQAQTAKFREVIAQRTGERHAAVERLKQAKHDCPDPVERANLSDQLRKAEQSFVAELQRTLDDLLPEAFATVREASRRLVGSEVMVTGHPMKWDMVPYDVQLIGGIVLHQGRIADTQPGSPERRAAYFCDITYGTNNEFGFDYLRDNMVGALEQRVQRGHVYAIIDEVDSILIDEARTPLIISGAVGTESDEKYALYNAQVVQLVRKQTAIANDLVARGEPLLASGDTNYEGAKLLYKAQLGMPKNKKLLKLLNEQGVKQLVQRVELDRLADRKLPARDQKMRDIEDDLYFVMDERGRSVHLTDKGVETMSPQDPTLFIVPDISHAIHELDRDLDLPPAEKIERRRAVEAEYATKSETLHI